MVDVRLRNPEVAVGQRRPFVRLPKVEVGIEYTMGKDMLHVLAQWNQKTAPRFPESVS
jgi:hypothetical protein